MKLALVVGLIPILFCCNRKQTSYFLPYELNQLADTEVTNRSRSAIQRCKDPLNYIPTDDYALYFDQRTIRVNIHVPDHSDGENNFKKEEGDKYFKYLIDNANDRLSRNQKMNLPEDNDTPAYDPQYRYQLTPSPEYPTNSGIYYYFDDDLSYFINKGKGRNNYSREIIKAHAIHDDTILNAFMMPHHPDSLKSKKYKAFGAGIALGSSIKLAGAFQLKRKSPWELATLFNHEIGHVYGLSHAWGRDGCEDTPTNPNCFYSSGVAPCDGIVSNNMMDYNNSQMAISPCQLGKIHRKISDTSSFQRKLVIPTWCELEPNNPIIISDSVEWKGARDVSRNIIIEKGGYLKMCCRLSMPRSSFIQVKVGGILSLDNITLHNDCGDTWEGILIEHSGDQMGKVIQEGKIEIINISKQS